MKLDRIHGNTTNISDILKNRFQLIVQDPKYIKLTDSLSYKLNNIKKSTQIKESLYRKLTDINNWYTRILGLDEVKKFQDRVIILQEKLLATQEKRRAIQTELGEVRKNANQLQDELLRIKRQEDPERYFNLMKQETEVLKLEHQINVTFQEYDKTERDIFTAYSNAVRDSHEKQRAQAEYTKYFSIALSITGSFLAFCYSTIRKQDIKHYITEQFEQVTHYNPDFVKSLQTNYTEMSRLLKDVELNNKKLVMLVENKQNGDVDHTDMVKTLTIFAGVCLLAGYVCGKLFS